MRTEPNPCRSSVKRQFIEEGVMQPADNPTTRATDSRPNRTLLMLVSALVIAWLFAPVSATGQEPLKIIYSQLTMTNSATWFAREAGIFERHGLTADLIYVDSAPAVQALT